MFDRGEKFKDMKLTNYFYSTFNLFILNGTSIFTSLFFFYQLYFLSNSF